MRSLKKLHEQYTTHTSPTDCPTQRLGTLETWSSKWGWQERIEEWQEQLRIEQEKADEQARLDERQKRKDMLEAMREKIEDQMDEAGLGDAVSIKAMNALTNAFKAYMDLSMKTYNDLPTEKKDLTSDGQPLKVNFITEPVPEEMVKQRLKALGLDNLVDEHSS